MRRLKSKAKLRLENMHRNEVCTEVRVSPLDLSVYGKYQNEAFSGSTKFEKFSLNLPALQFSLCSSLTMEFIHAEKVKIKEKAKQ